MWADGMLCQTCPYTHVENSQNMDTPQIVWQRMSRSCECYCYCVTWRSQDLSHRRREGRRGHSERVLNMSFRAEICFLSFVRLYLNSLKEHTCTRMQQIRHRTCFSFGLYYNKVNQILLHTLLNSLLSSMNTASCLSL